MTLDEIKNAASSACTEFEVERLYAFGSTARGTTTSTSDIDLLVEFKDPDRAAAKRFFGLLHYLEDTLNCQIDLLTISSLRNPYFKERVLKERITIYEA
ncbi:MAG: nucleotidyltransferase domain-containing protein [bacterium]